MNWRVKKSKLSGRVIVPPSKSQTMRAIIFASLASGHSTIRNVLRSPDVDAMIKACQGLGARMAWSADEPDCLLIEGVGGQPIIEDGLMVDAGNSGIVLRFIAALAALSDKALTLAGDESVQRNRPVMPLVSALRQLGADCELLGEGDRPPLRVSGPIKAGCVRLDGADSQPVSALLIASVLLAGSTEIRVDNPGEKPWIDMTLGWLDRFGVFYENHGYQRYVVHGSDMFLGFEYTVPGDWSSAAYPVVAAVLTGSALRVDGLDFEDLQGDKRLIDVLIDMGANIRIDKQARRLVVAPVDQPLRGAEIDINDMIDAVTILAVVGCCAEGITRLTGAGIARYKESDRLAVMCAELKKMGAKIQALPDGLVIEGGALQGAVVESHGDHRVAMSLFVAGLVAQGETHVRDVVCVKKSYPGFFELMQCLRAEVGIAA